MKRLNPIQRATVAITTALFFFYTWGWDAQEGTHLRSYLFYECWLGPAPWAIVVTGAIIWWLYRTQEPEESEPS